MKTIQLTQEEIEVILCALEELQGLITGNESNDPRDIRDMEISSELMIKLNK